jgi:hypothetical protein
VLVAAVVFAFAGTSAFEHTYSCPLFDYLSKPENKDQEDTFNHLMPTFTTTMEATPAKLYVSILRHMQANLACS